MRRHRLRHYLRFKRICIIPERGISCYLMFLLSRGLPQVCIPSPDIPSPFPFQNTSVPNNTPPLCSSYPPLTPLLSPHLSILTKSAIYSPRSLFRATNLSGANRESIRLKIQTWNNTLISKSQKFHSTHPDVHIKIYDSFALFNRVIDEPWTYGFKSPNKKFMGSEAREEDCIWYDALHPTTALYKVLTEDLYEVLMLGKEGVGINGEESARGDLSNEMR